VGRNITAYIILLKTSITIAILPQSFQFGIAYLARSVCLCRANGQKLGFLSGQKAILGDTPCLARL